MEESSLILRPCLQLLLATCLFQNTYQGLPVIGHACLQVSWVSRRSRANVLLIICRWMSRTTAMDIAMIRATIFIVELRVNMYRARG